MKWLNEKLTKSWVWVLVVVMGMIPGVWFWGKGAVLINGVDTNFPLQPVLWLARRFFVWNNIVNGGADFSSSTAGVFFHLVQVTPFVMGLSLQAVEILSLIFWFLLVVVAALILARAIFPQKPWVQIVFVTLYGFNTYIFNTWENVKVANLAVLVGLPLSIAILIKLRRGSWSWKKAMGWAGLVGVIVSGSGINPAYFVSFLGGICLFSLGEVIAGGGGGVVSGIKRWLVVAVPVVAVNLFWLLPTANFILGNVPASGSLERIGFVNWTNSLSENTSLFNVIRMQGAWDWYAIDSASGLPLYIPYALNYFHRLPFLGFSMMLPALAIASFLVRDGKKKYLSLGFGLMWVVGVGLGVGTHEPMKGIFQFLSRHLPFFSLFRSPWYIFTPWVVLATAGLVGLFWAWAEEGGRRWRFWGGRVCLPLLTVVLVVGNLVYCYPLVTGKIFRPGRKDGFFVKFPPYVLEVGKWLAGEGERGRIIGYPGDEIEEFKWGYRGIESVLELVADREVLFAPLNGENFPVASLVKNFYENLRKGEMEGAFALGAKLDAGEIFVKRDQQSLALKLPEVVGRLPLTSFGEWDFYEFPKGWFTPKISLASGVWFGKAREGAKALEVLGREEMLVNPDDSVVKQVPGIAGVAGRVILAENSQKQEVGDFVKPELKSQARFLPHDLSNVEFKFSLPESGWYEPVLERYKLEDFGVETAGVVEVRVDREESKWKVNKVTDAFLYFAPVQFGEGDHTVGLTLVNRNLVVGGDLSDDRVFEPRGEGEFIEGEEAGGERFLSILNRGGEDISARFVVSNFDPNLDYLVSCKYKRVGRNDASLVVGQASKRTLFKNQLERLPNYSEWVKVSVYYEPVRTESGMQVDLISPADRENPLGSKVLYKDLAVFGVFSNDLLLVKKGRGALGALPEVDSRQVSPVLYEGEVKGGSEPHIISFLENYSPNWELSMTGLGGKELLTRQLHFSANVYGQAWYIAGAPEDYKFRVYYKPQRWFNVGAVISGLSLVLFAALAGIGRKDEKKN